MTQRGFKKTTTLKARGNCAGTCQMRNANLKGQFVKNVVSNHFSAYMMLSTPFSTKCFNTCAITCHRTLPHTKKQTLS